MKHDKQTYLLKILTKDFEEIAPNSFERTNIKHFLFLTDSWSSLTSKVKLKTIKAWTATTVSQGLKMLRATFPKKTLMFTVAKALET